jgi:hypothetical protein
MGRPKRRLGGTPPTTQTLPDAVLDADLCGRPVRELVIRCAGEVTSVSPVFACESKHVGGSASPTPDSGRGRPWRAGRQFEQDRATGMPNGVDVAQPRTKMTAENAPAASRRRAGRGILSA